MSAMIGVLVHTRRLELFRRAAQVAPDADLHWLSYDHPDQAAEKLPELAGELDGLLVDQDALGAAEQHCPESLTVRAVSPTAAELTTAMARARAHFPQQDRNASVDGFDRTDVDDVSHALDLPATSTACTELDELVEHHRKTLRESGVAITARAEVAEVLAPEGPVLTAELTPATIRAGLSELLSRVETRRAEAMRAAAAVFHVRDGDDIEGARAGLREILLRDPDLSGAWVENRGKRGLVVFAHQGLLERATEGWQVVPALQDAQLKLGIRAAAGFGVGASVTTGISLAERAAVRAEAEEHPCGFLIQDSGTIIGPIGGGERRTRFSYRDHGAELERLATEAGLSPTTLSRLVALEREVHGRALTPSELATLLGITDPSGRRLIRKLQAADLVSPEGSAHPTRRGRPTRLYRLRLADTIGRAT